MRPPRRIHLVRPLSNVRPKPRLHWTLRASAVLILLSLFVLGAIAFTTAALRILN